MSWGLLAANLAAAASPFWRRRLERRMPARTSGKVKAWVYAFAGIGGLLAFSMNKLGWPDGGAGPSAGVAFWLFVVAAAVALWSLADYGYYFIRNFRKTS